MPQSMRRRQSNQQLETDLYRADSVASAETFMTSATDYETPRSAAASIGGGHGSINYGFSAPPRYNDSSTVSAGYPFTSVGGRHFAYNNDAFINEQFDVNGGNKN